LDALNAETTGKDGEEVKTFSARGDHNPRINNEHIEFIVEADEDIFLVGTENTLKRVTAGANYECMMLKTQQFSSLFRHYAKYHGLSKDGLEFRFLDVLNSDETPEAVHLLSGDTIRVCMWSSLYGVVICYVVMPLTEQPRWLCNSGLQTSR
jgi:hypothetical protein